MNRRLIQRYTSISASLPMLERCSFHTGIAAVVFGAAKTETGSPILGGVCAVIGALLLAGSLNTTKAISALDDRGDSLL